MTQSSTGHILDHLTVPWSDAKDATDAEKVYRAAGLVRTTGTVFSLPPSPTALHAAFAQSHKSQNLTVGARALCKHHERRPAESAAHPYWPTPTGTEAAKSAAAERLFWDISNAAVWRNVHGMNAATVVYEIRNAEGYGMRWFFADAERPVFRGFLEPFPHWHINVRQDPT
ncbi:hypothetical protein HDU89_001951 [Geranomyces variabilis]|nr:hypothetical protein HDU89_001951 [Geranomyces variabilis]